MKEDGCNFINEQGDLCFAQTIVNDNGVTNTIITILEQKSENIGLVPETVFETNIVKYDNFYIKEPIEMLGVPIPLPDFLNGEEYMTIPEYLIKNSKSEVKYFTLDGKILHKRL